MSRLSIKDKAKLDKFYNIIEHDLTKFIGYPANMAFDYTELYRFLKFFLNNIGDPFVSDQYASYRHQMEREVLNFFGRLMHAGKNFWGYVTNGGTESNLYGLYLARENFPNSIVFYSYDTHYSIQKSLRVLQMKYKIIKSQQHGEIDYSALERAIHANRKRVPIVVATIGTTMKGAVDQVLKIRSIMKDLKIKKYYIHCDAALNGMVFPFIKNAPAFDFSAGADSIAISGHKFIGSPIACGVLLAKKSYADKLSNSVEYAQTIDNTLLGSRSGLASLILWYSIRSHGVVKYKKIVKRCMENADYAIKQFHKVGIPAWRNQHSLIIVFPCSSRRIIEKWHLAPQQGLAHIVTMPHVTRALIDELIADMEKDGK
ncbi:MAG TPA: histidine decarboxylase [Gammaproteobacteria bacterium]|jgi:histidine decarboxylase|nr:histidine decarboxylase [Gammaproteobacteria bacterium]